MPKQLPIAMLGDPILRQPAQDVVDINDPKIQELIDDMIYTCQQVDGVGIAAPQVFRSLRLFIMASKPSARYPHAPLMEPMALINPVLEAALPASNNLELGWEGCLSIPGIRGRVQRYKSIDVSFLDRYGNRHERIFEGFLARIFEHELDHLHGLVFLDQIASHDIIVESEFQKLVALGKHLNP